MTDRTALRIFGALATAALLWVAPRATAQTEPPGADAVANPSAAPAPEEASASPASPKGDAAGEEGPVSGLADLLRASGWVGAILCVMSVAAVALILEQLLTVRRAKLTPRGMARDLHAAITAGEYVAAEQLCKTRPSYLGYVVLAGLHETPMGYRAVEKAMEEASDEQAARLFRKAEYLSLIAMVAPMLGLLGTVYGILLAFRKIAETQGAALAAELAGGVYLALITTVMGLVVAIPSLVAYAVFRSRIEELTAESNVVAEQIFVNFKRSRRRRPRD